MVTNPETPSRWRRQIGIVGGLGPFAHIELERRLLEAAERKLGHVPGDQELPPWIVVSLPQTPDRTAALLSGGESPVSMLARSLNLLRGCDFAVIACNTAHAFLPQIKSLVSLPILDTIEETIRQAVDRFGSDVRLGLLASTGTLVAKVYPETARRISPGVQFLTPFDLPEGESLQAIVMNSIYGKPAGIKCGGLQYPEIRAGIERDLFHVVDQFPRTEVSAVIVGCTELSLVLHGSASNGMPFLDPLDAAARAAVEIAAGDQDIPQ